MTTTPLSQLLATAYGDAYALPFEYRKGAYKTWSDLNNGAHYELHPAFSATTKPGNFSDDTQMSIAVAETMLDPAFPGQMADSQGLFDHRFITAFQRNRHAGYSRGMSEGFEKAISEGRTIGSICQQHGKTEKSGAAMRATPLGLLPNVADVRFCAAHQGEITHTGSALLAAEMAALAAHYMYYRLGPRHNMLQFVRAHASAGFPARLWSGKVGSPGMESVRAALTAVLQATSLHDLLIRCVAFTGDVDTVAAVAMGSAWGYPDLPNNLPPALWDELENGPFGRDWLVALDAELMARYPRPQP